MIQLNEVLIPVIERLARIESKLQEKQMPKLMTIKDIMSYTSYSETTIRRHIKRQTLKPFKDEGKKLFVNKDGTIWKRHVGWNPGDEVKLEKEIIEVSMLNNPELNLLKGEAAKVDSTIKE